MKSVRISASVMRGGTSKGLFLDRVELENIVRKCGLSKDQVLRRLMGGNDPSGMQLDGLGGGISSTSKVAVMGMKEGTQCTVEYNFAQVAIKSTDVDWKANCGNLAAAAGLYAKERGLGIDFESHFAEDYCMKKIWQANHQYLMHVHLPKDSESIPIERWTQIAGVPSFAPPILVEIPESASPKKLFPSGKLVDTLATKSGEKIDATILVASNPTIFIDAKSFDLQGHELPSELKYTEKILPEVEHLMKQAGELLQIPVTSAMRVCWVASPVPYKTTDGKSIESLAYDIQSRITTEGRVHHAHTTTGALNLGIAASIPGTVPYRARKEPRSGPVRIGHPAGTMSVSAKVRGEDSVWFAESVGTIRTARTLIKGDCFIEPLAYWTDRN